MAVGSSMGKAKRRDRRASPHQAASPDGSGQQSPVKLLYWRMSAQQPDFLQMVIDVFRAQAPNARDSIHRGILRLLLRTGWSFEKFLGPLATLEERGWLVLQDETYFVTNAGAEAFGGKAVPTGDPQPNPSPAEPPPATKVRKRKRRE
jgi:hypothetical protein